MRAGCFLLFCFTRVPASCTTPPLHLQSIGTISSPCQPSSSLSTRPRPRSQQVYMQSLQCLLACFLVPPPALLSNLGRPGPRAWLAGPWWVIIAHVFCPDVTNRAHQQGSNGLTATHPASPNSFLGTPNSPMHLAITCPVNRSAAPRPPSPVTLHTRPL